MFKITYFDKKLCHLMRHHLDQIDENVCEIFSIWNFCPRSRWKAVESFSSGKYLCRAQHFSLIYWLVLVISVLGSVHSFYELVSLCARNPKHLVMWRPRKFYVLPPSVLRKFRFVGAFIRLSSCLLLCYALIKVSPTHMAPWLIINKFVIGIDLITWIIEVFSGVCKMEFHSVFVFLLPIINYLFVCCVHSVFEEAIDMNDVEDLSLWKRFKF